MTKFFIYIIFFLLMVCPAQAQPLKKTKLREKPATITMADFRYRAYTGQPSSSSPGHLMQTKPGVAMLGSVIVPGLGQAVNKKWVRAGAYFLADVVFLAVHFNSINKAKEREREYWNFANANWSVVTYAQWLIEYHDQNNIFNPYIDELRQQVDGITPAYNTQTDWTTVDIELLRDVERETPFISPNGSGNTFSHVMPDYGSQQYYELISKYYQYGPGWKDFGSDRNGNSLDNLYQLAWDGSDMPFNFFEGSALAERFNDKYRLAGNMLSLLVLNHVVSAFDALFTVKIKNNRLETETNLFGARQFTLKYHF